MNLEMLTALPILLRIATGLTKLLGGSSTSVDWISLVDSIMEFVKKFPAAIRFVEMLQPWIDKLKQIIMIYPTGPTTANVSLADLKAAEAIVKLNEAVMQRMIDEGLMAQNAITTDDDVIDNT